MVKCENCKRETKELFNGDVKEWGRFIWLCRECAGSRANIRGIEVASKN